ncbi:MAG: TetR/AcrR family transcriptional regulator [Burkholderiaceae bacterium]
MVLHALFELIWQYRFLYRDLNDLLSKNRRLELHFQTVLPEEQDPRRAQPAGQHGARGRALQIDSREIRTLRHQHGWWC